MLYHKNAWAGTTTMIKIATKIVEVKKDKFGRKSALMALDDLGAYCVAEAKCA